MDKCTVYSKTISPNLVLDCLKSMNVEVQENQEKWDAIKVKLTNGELSINNMVRNKPGDEFSKIILGTYNYCNRIDSPNDKKPILQHIAETNWLLGITLTPGFSENDEGVEAIMNICSSLDGLIFDGKGILDKSGVVILGE